MKRLITTILICALICSLAVMPAQALTQAQSGVDMETTVLAFEAENASEDQILSFVSRIISENQNTPRRFEISFPYMSNSTTFGKLVNWMIGELDDVLCGLWPCGDSFAFVSVSAQRTSYSRFDLLVCVDTAGAYDPTGRLAELYATVREIGEAAKTASDTERGQLAFINRRLCELISYDAAADPYNPYDALIEGRAACSGYTACMSLLCRYLGILGCTVSGPGHIWNSVFVDGAWRMLDVTWNDTSSTQDKYFLVNIISDDSGAHNADSDIVTSSRMAARAHHQFYMLSEQYRTASAWMQSHCLDAGDGVITRGELAALVADATGNKPSIQAAPALYAESCSMTDVPDDLCPYVGFCVQSGLMYGYGSGLFGPDDAATISDACTVILRMLRYDEAAWDHSNARDTACTMELLPSCYLAEEPASNCALEILLYNALTMAGGAYGG